MTLAEAIHSRVEEFRWKSDCPPRCDMTAEDLYGLMADFAISEVNEALERAAQECDGHVLAKECAARIRALKGN